MSFRQRLLFWNSSQGNVQPSFIEFFKKLLFILDFGKGEAGIFDYFPQVLYGIYIGTSSIPKFGSFFRGRIEPYVLKCGLHLGVTLLEDVLLVLEA